MDSKFFYFFTVTMFQGVLAMNKEKLSTFTENDVQLVNNSNETNSTENEGVNLVSTSKIDDKTQSPNVSTINSTSYTCPKDCVCFSEGTDIYLNLVVNCSSLNLSVFPEAIDNRCTELILDDNNITMLPTTLNLPKLKVLTVKNNSLNELDFQFLNSISSLKVFNAANNRIQKLHNIAVPTKVEELNLGNNQFTKQEWSTKLFKNWTSLRKLTLFISTADLVDLCESLGESLETVCNISCKIQSIQCQDITKNNDDKLFDATLPGMLVFTTAVGINSINEILEDNKINISKSASSENMKQQNKNKTFTKLINVTSSKLEPVLLKVDAPLSANNKSLRDLGLGNDTRSANVKAGEVDRKVILAIAIGMILVIIGVSIRKNWNSIKAKLERTESTEQNNDNMNVTSPEETPLKQKSLV